MSPFELMLNAEMAEKHKNWYVLQKLETLSNLVNC